MIATGRATLSEAPHYVFVPSAVPFRTVLAFNTLAERTWEWIDRGA